MGLRAGGSPASPALLLLQRRRVRDRAGRLSHERSQGNGPESGNPGASRRRFALMPAAGESIKPAVPVLCAGPAGMRAACELARRGIGSLVLDRDSLPGGLARTVDYKGYLFALGGHRFYTKLTLIERIWLEVLGDDFLARPRLSRIYFRSKFFHYPLNPLNVVRGLGPVEVLRCAFSYVWSHIFPEKPEKSLDAWVTNRFGRRLFEMFFKTYTEKVWGVPCSELSADWAAQRIRGLSLKQVLIDAFRLRRDPDKQQAIK